MSLVKQDPGALAQKLQTARDARNKAVDRADARFLAKRGKVIDQAVSRRSAVRALQNELAVEEAGLNEVIKSA